MAGCVGWWEDRASHLSAEIDTPSIKRWFIGHSALASVFSSWFLIGVGWWRHSGDLMALTSPRPCFHWMLQSLRWLEERASISVRQEVIRCGGFRVPLDEIFGWILAGEVQFRLLLFLASSVIFLFFILFFFLFFLFFLFFFFFIPAELGSFNIKKKYFMRRVSVSGARQSPLGRIITTFQPCCYVESIKLKLTGARQSHLGGRNGNLMGV